MIVLKDKAERIIDVRVTVVVLKSEYTCTCRITKVTATVKPWIGSENEIGV